jgi:hypothetical protein
MRRVTTPVLQDTPVGTTKEMKTFNKTTNLRYNRIHIYQYRENWKENADRVSSDMIPKMILKYQPKGKRKPLKIWKDSVL